MDKTLRIEIAELKKKRYHLMKALIELEQEITNIDAELERKTRALNDINQTKRQ